MIDRYTTEQMQELGRTLETMEIGGIEVLLAKPRKGLAGRDVHGTVRMSPTPDYEVLGHVIDSETGLGEEAVGVTYHVAPLSEDQKALVRIALNVDGKHVIAYK